MKRLSIPLFLALLAWGCGEDDAATRGPECSLEPPSCPYGTYCRISVDNTIECVRSPMNGPSFQDAGAANRPVNDGALEPQPERMDVSVTPQNDSGVASRDATVEPPNQCGDIRILLKPSVGATARVMLVVDRSYSMVESEDRWTPITDALIEVTRALEGAVEFGLVTFPDPNQARFHPASSKRVCPVEYKFHPPSTRPNRLRACWMFRSLDSARVPRPHRP